MKPQDQEENKVYVQSMEPELQNQEENEVYVQFNGRATIEIIDHTDRNGIKTKKLKITFLDEVGKESLVVDSPLKAKLLTIVGEFDKDIFERIENTLPAPTKLDRVPGDAAEMNPIIEPPKPE